MSRINLTVHSDDNVSTLLDTKIDDHITADGILMFESIPFGHKIAIKDIAKGQAIIKYGVPIGIATQNIKAGGHVHVQNCR
jgi:altronate dehydratase